MPARSKIDLLPEAIRKELEQRLIKGSFSNYTDLVKWLQEQGLEISRSSVHRFGQSLERAQKALKDSTDMAIALTDYAGDDAGKLNDAMMRIYIQKLFHVLLEMEDLDPENIDFIKLGRAIAEVTRSSTNSKKWMMEVREKAETAADEAVKVAKSGGLSEEKAEEIRKKILGIV